MANLNKSPAALMTDIHPAGAVDICTFDRGRFREVVLEVTKEVTRQARGKTARAEVAAAARSMAKQLLTVLESPAAGVVTQEFPTPFRGVRADGNPIVFLVRHYRPKIEARGFYQADLLRIDDKLFHALRNTFRDRNWHRIVQTAANELEREKLPRSILGRDVALITALADLVPPRRHIRAQAAPDRLARAL
jgi:hypothetical protein